MVESAGGLQQHSFARRVANRGVVSEQYRMFECNLAKVEVDGSNPITRSNFSPRIPTLSRFAGSARSVTPPILCGADTFQEAIYAGTEAVGLLR